MMNVVALLSGFLFAIGLVISGMTNPKKVIGFLDIFGSWDYSLAFVMIGAIAINVLTFNFVKRKKPLFSLDFILPLKKSVDSRLIIGASLFGIGWGLVGICPGPGIVNLMALNSSAALFVVSMVAGMYLFKKFDNYNRRQN
ncbi:YeeE/YedE family protein [Halobacteriovorax marinus]|uniref:DUF6691 family protein n=1 Tax=Halobacteriovorax marinus TaxID=97084 RepID=UPI000BC2FF9C|nr:DUF6691 family protein [Halobacteriovorax marinus]ATH07165.1 YeeE/YedE family protein [Halobacteriovorax marinus]